VIGRRRDLPIEKFVKELHRRMLGLWGGQSWPQPPFRRPEPAESRLRAELPAPQEPNRPTTYACIIRACLPIFWRCSLRARDIEALRAADDHDIRPLLTFARA
jgi:hypothetical protein